MMKLEVNQEVFGAFAFYSAILAGKMILMSLLTAKQRFAKGVFANKEDIANGPKKFQVRYDDDDVERVRRAHLNDMENILPYFIIALLYCFTSPEVGTAILLFRVFTGARVLHTIVYAVVPLPQPSRALAFFAGFAVQAYMIFKIATYFA